MPLGFQSWLQTGIAYSRARFGRSQNHPKMIGPQGVILAYTRARFGDFVHFGPTLAPIQDFAIAP